MNTILFKEHTDMLLEILEKSNISPTEKNFRKRKRDRI